MDVSARSISTVALIGDVLRVVPSLCDEIQVGKQAVLDLYRRLAIIHQELEIGERQNRTPPGDSISVCLSSVENLRVILMEWNDATLGDRFLHHHPMTTALLRINEQVEELFLLLNLSNRVVARWRKQWRSQLDEQLHEMVDPLLFEYGIVTAPLLQVVFARVGDKLYGEYETAYSIARMLCIYGGVWSFDCESQWQAVRDRVALESGEAADWSRWQCGLASCVKIWLDELQESGAAAPLVEVPIEVVKRGEDSVKTYLAQLDKTTAEELIRRRKICVVGQSEAGKTSLVKSLMAMQPHLVGVDNRTIGIDLFPLTFADETPTDERVERDRYEVTCWDFAGQDIYRVAHSLFFSKRTLYLLCVDLQAYCKVLDDHLKRCTSDSEAEMQRFLVDRVFRWMRLILARQPDAEFSIVGTKTDSLKCDHVEDALEDLQERLQKWTDGFVKEHEGSVQAAVKKSLKGLMSSDKLRVSMTTSEGVLQAKQAVQKAIIDKRERAFVMPLLYTVELNAIKTRRQQVDSSGTTERVSRMIVSSAMLIKELTNEIADLNADECCNILRTLHDLGDILWYEDHSDGAFEDVIFLDPNVVLDIVREVVNHNHTLRVGEAYDVLHRNGEMKHELLITFPLWRALANKNQDGVLRFKRLLQYFNLAYPVGLEEMAFDSDIFVPAYWKIERQATQVHSNIEAELSTGSSVARWQYSISTELSETVFDQFIVQSHSRLFVRKVTACWMEVRLRNDVRVWTIRPFIARIFYECGCQTKDNLRIEVAAEDHSGCWRLMRFFVMAMEKVLMGYPGLRSTGREIILRARPGEKDTTYSVTRLAKRLCVATKERCQEQGLPIDLNWFAQKVWESSTNLREIESKERDFQVEKHEQLIQQLMQVNYKSRRFPALWTLQYSADEPFQVKLSLLSDLSGYCCHEPFCIEISPTFISKHRMWLTPGLSIVPLVSSTITSNILEIAAIGVNNPFQDVQALYTCTDEYCDTEPNPFEKADVSSLAMLHDLLMLHRDTADESKVLSKSNLVCGVTDDGYHVWAHPHEISVHEGLQIRKFATNPDDTQPAIPNNQLVLETTETHYPPPINARQIIHNLSTRRYTTDEMELFFSEDTKFLPDVADYVVNKFVNHGDVILSSTLDCKKATLFGTRWTTYGAELYNGYLVLYKSKEPTEKKSVVLAISACSLHINDGGFVLDINHVHNSRREVKSIKFESAPDLFLWWWALRLASLGGGAPTMNQVVKDRSSTVATSVLRLTSSTLSVAGSIVNQALNEQLTRTPMEQLHLSMMSERVLLSQRRGHDHPSITHLILVRHGETANMQFRVADQEKVLTQRGREQAALVASEIAKMLVAASADGDNVRLISGGLQRTVETTQAFEREMPWLETSKTCLLEDGAPKAIRQSLCEDFRTAMHAMAFEYLRRYIPTDSHHQTANGMLKNHKILICHASFIQYCIAKSYGTSKDIVKTGAPIGHCSITQIKIINDGASPERYEVVFTNRVSHLPLTHRTSE